LNTCAICPEPATPGFHLCAAHHATLYFTWDIRCVKTGRKAWLNGRCADEYSGERKVNGKWLRLDGADR
jgi:hypothetical protein